MIEIKSQAKALAVIREAWPALNIPIESKEEALDTLTQAIKTFNAVNEPDLENKMFEMEQTAVRFRATPIEIARATIRAHDLLVDKQCAYDEIVDELKLGTGDSEQLRSDFSLEESIWD